MNENLKVTGILNIVFSSLYFLASLIGGFIPFICFIYLLVSGILFLNYSKSNNLSEKRNTILVLSILCLPVCFVSAIINLISIGKVEPKKIRGPNIEPETKRIDILIKLGVCLISLSGLLFINNGWNTFSSYTVVIFLIVLTVLFFLLYILFTTKIKLESSSKLYLILFNMFLILIYLALGHYNLLGNYFSTTGLGSDLYYSILWIIISLLTFNLKETLKNNNLIYFVFTTITLSIYNILKFLGFDIIQTLVIINVLTIFINYISKNNYLFKYTDILIKIFIIISGLSLLDGYSLSLIIFIILNILVLNYYNIKNNSILLEVITPILTIFYIGTILGITIYEYNYMYTFNCYILSFTGILSMIYIIIIWLKIFNNKIISKRIFSILYNIILFTLSIISMFLESFILQYIIIIRIFMLFSYYFYEYKKNIKDVEYYLISFNITILFLCILVYLNNIISLNTNIILLSLMALLTIYYFFINNKILNIITYILLIIINIINVFASLYNSNEIIISLTLVSSAIPYILLSIKNYKEFDIYAFVYTLITSFIILCNNIYDNYFGIILNMALYLVLYIMFYKDKKYNKYILLLFGLILIRLISKLDIMYDYKYLLINISLMYMLFILLYRFINNFDTRKVLFIIISSIIFLLVIFNSNYIFGLYIGIISLILILYSSIKDNYKSIFVYSLILMIINIIYRLNSIWHKIPLWGYLLFAGLTIIIFATIKEIKKSSKK